MSESGKWHRYIDDYSEHYEITDTNRERAEVGDGHLFRMGDKDDANTLADYLNSLEASLVAVKSRFSRTTATDQQAIDTRGKVIVSLTSQLAEVKAERDKYKQALEVIASFNDKGANEHLESTGSYGAFDEPESVVEARNALSSS